MSKIQILVVELLLLIVVPVFGLMWSASFLAIRPALLGLGAIYCLSRLWFSHATWDDLGIRRAGFVNSLKSLMIPSLILVLVTYLLFVFLPHPILVRFVGYDPLVVPSFTNRLIAYIFLSSPIQEFIFRGYLTWRLKQVFTHQLTIKLVSVSLFTFVHLPFYSPLLLLISATMGFLYIWVYSRDRNLYAPTISHSLIGASLIIIRNAWLPY